VKPSVTAASADAGPAFVSVSASPWAYVLVDGVERGESPVVELEVRPGRHVIRAVNPLMGSDETAVELTPGQRWSWKAQPHR
jgi:hypothetical protein